MPRFRYYVPHGVIPATLLAMHDDFSIDGKDTRRHVRHVAATPGLSVITVNGHASEVHACTPGEQERILDITLEEIGDRLPVISGVWAAGSANAARIARMAERRGASALLVFPSQMFSMGGRMRPEMALAHFSTIAAATDLPLIVFAYARRSTLSHPLDTLVKMAESIPSIRAIKDWSNDPMPHERQIRVLQSLPRPVNVLTTHSAWLMASLTLGCNGLLSGSGSVIPELQAALFQAVRAGDLNTARAINDRIHPLAQAFYAAPALDMHNRMKECLVMPGRMERAVVRASLARITDAERARPRMALKEAGLLDGEGLELAAQARSRRSGVSWGQSGRHAARGARNKPGHDVKSALPGQRPRERGRLLNRMNPRFIHQIQIRVKADDKRGHLRQQRGDGNRQRDRGPRLQPRLVIRGQAEGPGFRQDHHEITDHGEAAWTCRRI